MGGAPRRESDRRPRLKILIIGGYGTFGGRLARLLADERRLELLIAGRSPGRAEAFCAALSCDAVLRPVRFDRDGDAVVQIGALAPDLVVDASGPWQAYGERPYRVVEACIALGLDYCDLADGSAFVTGVASFDERAKAKGVTVLSGVSTCPVLTAAAVRALARGLDSVEDISGGIAPSPQARLGPNVIRAVTAYAGKPVALVKAGKRAFDWGLMSRRRVTVGVPGGLPLDCRLFSLVDVPDLTLLPSLWPQAQSVWMGAAPVPEVLHRALNAASWLPRLGLLPSLTPFAAGLHTVVERLRWGAPRGGMYVRVVGCVGDTRVQRTWNLVAEGDDGPFIPSMAVEALIRGRLAGMRPPPGARPCLEELELEDYAPSFARRNIATGIDETDGATTNLPLYPRVLGAAWGRLPCAIRNLHEAGDGAIFAGSAAVDGAANPFSRLIGRIVGFPEPGEGVPVRVAFRVRDGVETWTRTFAGRSFASTQESGADRNARLIVERFGPVAFGLAPVIDGETLALVVRRWTLFGLAMPRFLAPIGDACELQDCEGRFRFDVEIAFPFLGRLVRYRGWLARLEGTGAAD